MRIVVDHAVDAVLQSEDIQKCGRQVARAKNGNALASLAQQLEVAEKTQTGSVEQRGESLPRSQLRSHRGCGDNGVLSAWLTDRHQGILESMGKDNRLCVPKPAGT